MSAASAATPTRNIVILGAGRVSRSVAAWCSAQNILRSTCGAQPQQQPLFSVTVYASEARAGAESLMSDLPWLAKRGRHAALPASAAGVVVTGDAAAAAKRVERADAVFYAVPMESALRYLTQRPVLLQALTLQQQQRGNCPLFLISRGLSLSSPAAATSAAAPPSKSKNAGPRDGGRIVVQQGLRTSHTANHLLQAAFEQEHFVPRGNDAASSSTATLLDLHCAATCLPEALWPSLMPLGGLLSHRALLDPAAALVDACAAAVVAHDAHERARLEEECAALAHSFAAAPALFSVAAPGGGSSSSSAANELLDELFGRGSVSPLTLRGNSAGARGAFLSHALCDSALLPAALGSGILRGYANERITAAAARPVMLQRAHDAFLRKLRSGADEALAYLNDGTESGVAADSGYAAFQSALMLASLGTGGSSCVGNVAELGRRLGEYATPMDAEASLFNESMVAVASIPNAGEEVAGHSAALHRTLCAWSSLSRHSKAHARTVKQKPSDDADDESVHAADTVFSALSDSLTGFHRHTVVAQLLAAPRAASADEDDYRVADAVLRMRQPFAEDVGRLDEAMNDANMMDANNMPRASLVRNTPQSDVPMSEAESEQQQQGKQTR